MVMGGASEAERYLFNASSRRVKRESANYLAVRVMAPASAAWEECEEWEEWPARGEASRANASARVPVSEAGSGHPFAQTAGLDEILFELRQLLVDQIVRLMNKAERNVRDDFCRPAFDELAVKRVALRRAPSEASHELRFA